MRVLLAEHDHALYADLLRAAQPDLDLVISDDPSTLAQLAPGCEVWLGEPGLLATVLRKGHQPQWFQSTWAGITPLLQKDLPTDYRLTRAVGIFGQVMSEYLLTYMLAHEREVLARLAAQVERRWDNHAPHSLAGRRVLIVGTGEIGLSVAQFLAAFGVELYGVASSARDLPPFKEVAAMDELPRLVGHADYVINLLPDTPSTHDIYDAALFARFLPTALFINAGRGVAVVDADLVAALREGHLAGAIIDVCRQEPLPARHPFWTAFGLLLTGHSSAPTLPPLMAQLFLDNLQRYQNGEPLRGEVDFSKGY
ncbi:D-2-hydroxyacid dehydrogenase [Pseudomonas sp. GV071]|uniref:D-2-hydroxyacid dehydrogenase n=1 Tax=Pseudomonas sp. GV071 TaxID=2135754 RepID=UPI000D39FC31|nr:D-2-hydroxyacid dehydrogenase [Pseudomonas sp. GV071]PTQ66658.1 phosphoglycerate dehydrogenase-like enzyme [Pseudomonas sp. GV071]